MNTAHDPDVLRTRIGVLTYLAPRTPRFSEDALKALQESVETCIAERDTQLVLDLGAVEVINSPALEALLDIQDSLVRRGGWLKLANLTSIVSDTLDLTGVSDLVTILEGGTPTPTQTAADPRLKNLRLGDLLVEKKLLTEDQLAEAMELQSKAGRKLGELVQEKGWVNERDMLRALADQLDLPFVRLKNGLFDQDVLELLDRHTANRLRMLPLFLVRGQLALATAEPQAYPAFEEIEERLRCRVRPVLTPREDIVRTINDVFEGSDLTSDIVADVDEDFEVVDNLLPDDYSAIDDMAAGSPIINLVNSMIQRAVRDGASDIHIEPARNRCRIRFRIDGVLYEVMTPRMELHPAIVSRLKVMANLDIAERRLPQDGRIQVQTQGRPVDLRFSSLPGLFGEKIVLRVLDKNQDILDLDRLGMNPRNVETYKQLLGRTHGLILVTGPTGSGKTTSLYAALNHLNSMEKNIVTIEDPVEYQIDIVNQNEVRANIGLTFSRILRHVLRQDPDIVMVGEIRDADTAEIAVQAALTGHLVLSTLHTNDSIGAVSRLIEMGVEPYLLSSALIGVIAQRLVRGICPNCKTTFLAPPEVVSAYGWEDQGSVMLVRGRGCQECYDSGYRGRLPIHEVLVANPEFQRLVMSNPSRDELDDYVAKSDISTIFSDGMQRVLDGKTTIEEISRVVSA